MEMDSVENVFQNMDVLCKGQRFYRTDLAEACLINMKVDPKGYIVYWTYEKEMHTVDHIDFSYILDVRYGKHARVPQEKVPGLVDKYFLEQELEVSVDGFMDGFMQSSNLDACFLTIITAFNTLTEERQGYHTFLAPSPEIAELWSTALFKFSRYRTIGNGSVLSSLEAIYAKLRYGTSTNKIRSKDIVKWFTSLKADGNQIERALQIAHLPAGTLDSVQPERLTELRLFKFYMFATQRKDVERLFQKLLRKCGVTVERQTSGLNHNLRTAVRNIGRRNRSNEFEVSEDESRTINAATLREFINKEQYDSRLNTLLYPQITLEGAMELVNKHENNTRIAKKGLMTFKGFLRFLLSDDNNAIAESCFKIDMGSPINYVTFARENSLRS